MKVQGPEAWGLIDGGRGQSVHQHRLVVVRDVAAKGVKGHWVRGWRNSTRCYLIGCVKGRGGGRGVTGKHISVDHRLIWSVSLWRI